MTALVRGVDATKTSTQRGFDKSCRAIFFPGCAVEETGSARLRAHGRRARIVAAWLAFNHRFHLSLLGFLRIEHYLSEHLAVGQILMRGTGVSQRKEMVDHGLEASGKNMAEDFVEFTHRAHVRAKQRKLTRKKEAQIDIGLGAGGCAAGDERSSRLSANEHFRSKSRARRVQ